MDKTTTAQDSPAAGAGNNSQDPVMDKTTVAQDTLGGNSNQDPIIDKTIAVQENPTTQDNNEHLDNMDWASDNEEDSGSGSWYEPSNPFPQI